MVYSAISRVNEVEGGCSPVYRSCSGSKGWTVELGAIQWEGAMVQHIYYKVRVRVGMSIMGHVPPYYRSKPCRSMGQEDGI